MRQCSRVALVWMVLMVVGGLVLSGCPKQPEIGRPGESPVAGGASTAPPPSAASPVIPAGGEPTVSRPALPAETPIGAGRGAGVTGAGAGPGGPGAPGGARAAGGPGAAGAVGPGAGQPGGAGAVSPLKDVFFEFDRYSLPEDQKPVLEQNLAWLRANPTVRVTIEGHCDERGTAEYNLGLGERRARTVKEFLVAGGIAAERLTTISYGKERPLVLGHDENAWKWNRRVHLAVTAR